MTALDASEAVIGLVAGGGVLPERLRAHLVSLGRQVRVVALDGECEIDNADATVGIGDVEGLFRAFERLGLTHVCLVGWVRRRPLLREARVGRRSIAAVWRLLRGLGRGDDSMLRAVVRSIEARGMNVVGVHELWPALVAEAGALGRHSPPASERHAIETGFKSAKLLGELDAGQAVVVVGKRIVALEGLEGTDEMLERVAKLRSEERLKTSRPAGVLVKAVKPSQELRADLPSIGPSTVEGVLAAGLKGIAVEAGATLILERSATIAAADKAGLFLFGHSRPRE